MPTSLHLTAAFSPADRLRPILDESVRAEGVDLELAELSPGEIFWRQLLNAEFDLSEMSLACLSTIVANGNTDWLPMPIFPVRKFFHTEILTQRSSDIRHPSQLVGKRIGVSEYQQSAAVWVRGILKQQFGFDPASAQWWMERASDNSHARLTGSNPPPHIHLEHLQPDTSLAEMLLNGKLDATFYYVAQLTALDRSVVDLKHHPAIRPLFDDYRAERRRYYDATGIVPLSHCIVLRRSLAKQHPDVVPALWQMFDNARYEALRRAARTIEPYADMGLINECGDLLVEEDALAYGLHGARRALEQFIEFQLDQGLLKRRVTVDEMFAECDALI